MESSESRSWEESSEISLQTDTLISKNNNTVKNADWRNNVSRVFEYNQTQQSKWTEIIQCYNCDKTLQLKGFNKHYINEHSQGKAIKYVTKMRYNVATKSGVWSTFTYNQTKSTKQRKRESKQIDTKTLMTKSDNTNIATNRNNISNNINSGGNNNDNNSGNNINGNSSDDNNNNSNSNSNNININMNDIINDNDNVKELHVDELVDNEHKEIIKETDMNLIQLMLHSNVRSDGDAKFNGMYENSERDPNVCNINEFYESFGLRHTCIDNDIYLLECIVCCKSLMNDSWEFTNAKVAVYPNRNSEHNRKQNNSAWIDERERGLKIYELHFSMLQEQIKYKIGDKSWQDRMLRRHKEGIDVGNKGHSTNWRD